MATPNQNPRRKTSAPKPVIRTVSPAVNPNQTAQISQLSNQLSALQKENTLLKKNITGYEKKLAAIKSIAVHMAAIASKNNSISAGNILDWGQKIMNTINSK